VDRIVIAGVVGSGKSTLAAQLAGRLAVPHVEKDRLLVDDDDDSAEHRAKVDAATCGERWVFDGTPFFVEDLVYGRADTIVVLDYARTRVALRVARRSFAIWVGMTTHPGQRRSPPWRWLAPDHPLRWAWSTFPARRAMFRPLPDHVRHARVLLLDTPRATARWLDTVGPTSIQSSQP
jgi:hypothetical protein